MQVAVATIRGVTPYSQSQPILAERLDKESADAYERRTWMERLHLDGEGNVIIPPAAVKKALEECAAYLQEKIPGKRNATWTKHFVAGVAVVEPPVVRFASVETVSSRSEVFVSPAGQRIEGRWLFLAADGKPNSSTRVCRCMPELPVGWEADVTFYVLDDGISEPVFAHHLAEAGRFIGIGRFRPRKGGYYGRFKVVKIEWKDSDE